MGTGSWNALCGLGFNTSAHNWSKALGRPLQVRLRVSGVQCALIDAVCFLIDAASKMPASATQLLKQLQAKLLKQLQEAPPQNPEAEVEASVCVS